MDSKTNNVGDHKVRPLAQIIAVTLSLLLMLMSLTLVNTNSFSASAHQITKKTHVDPPSTDTTTPSPSPTDTSTSSPSPTDTPMPSPSPSPTKAPTPKPTATPTSASGATPTATTPKPTSTALPGTTPASFANNQMPLLISGVPTSTTNNGNNGGNNNTPTTPTSGGFSLSYGLISMGLLTLLGFVGALFVGLSILRKRFLPSPIPQVSLPPSGAQPWRRVRTDSLNDITDVQSVPGVQNDWNNWPSNTGRAGGTPEIISLPQGGAPTMASNMGYNITNNNTFPSPSAGAFPGDTIPPSSHSPNTAVSLNTTAFSSPNNGNSLNNSNASPATFGEVSPAPNAADPQSRPFQATSNNNGVSPLSTVEQPPITAGVLSPQATKTASSLHPVPGITHADPITENIKPLARQISKPIRLQNIRNATPPPAAQNPALQNRNTEPISEENRNTEPISEEMPSLDDDTLKQYIQQGEIARQQHQNEEPGNA